MKKLFVMAVAICALTLTVNAQDAKKHELNDEQKAFMKEMVAKYDTNKDGKLDKEERAKMSAEDKAKMEKIMPHFGGNKKAKKSEAAATTSTNAPAAAQ